MIRDALQWLLVFVLLAILFLGMRWAVAVGDDFRARCAAAGGVPVGWTCVRQDAVLFQEPK